MGLEKILKKEKIMLWIIPGMIFYFLGMGAPALEAGTGVIMIENETRPHQPATEALQLINVESRNQRERNEQLSDQNEGGSGGRSRNEPYIPGLGNAMRELERMRRMTEALIRYNQSRGRKTFSLPAEGDLPDHGQGDGGEDMGVEVEIGETTLSPPPGSTGTDLVQESLSHIQPVSEENQDLLFGDMDGDGDFDFDDASTIAQIVFGLRNATDAERARADLNQDGVLDEWDVFLAALVLVGIITPEEARGATPESLGIDPNGIYQRTESFMDPHRGTLGVKQILIGKMSPQDVEKMMEMLLKHLHRLMETMAKMKGATSASGEWTQELKARLGDIFRNFDQYLLNARLLP